MFQERPKIKELKTTFVLFTLKRYFGIYQMLTADRFVL